MKEYDLLKSELSAKINEYKEQLMNLEAENSNLSTQLTEKSNEFENLKHQTSNKISDLNDDVIFRFR